MRQNQYTIPRSEWVLTTEFPEGHEWAELGLEVCIAALIILIPLMLIGFKWTVLVILFLVLLQETEAKFE